ncbi:MAG: hypothetical protein B7X06_00730, partial [Verrucomicrobia bacterium 21-51-4]
MPKPPTTVISIKDALQHLAAELNLAQVGDKKNVTTVHTLLAQIAAGSEDIAPLHEQAQQVICKINTLVRNKHPWSQESLHELESFVQWAQTATDAHKNQQPIPPWLPAPGELVAHPSEAALEDGQDYLLVIAEDADRELLMEFFEEANDHLLQIESSLLALENSPEVEEHINTLFRSFHTIKGVSGMLQLMPIQRLANDIESLLDLARKKLLVISSDIITLLLQAQDALTVLIGQVGAFIEQGIIPLEIVKCAQLSQKAKSICNLIATQPASAPQTQAAAPLFQASSATNNDLLTTKTQTGPTTASDTATIRVSTTKLDNLMDRVGELVIVQSQIEESVKNGSDDGVILNRNLAQLVRISKDLQRTSMSMRMVPIHPTFQKVSRWVRDLSRSMGKTVLFETHGEETELDRNVIEQIADPLMHMVRNALDHGIESAQQRIEAGKSEEGLIELKAYHLGGNIVIELSDDGQGIDPDKVLAKAIDQGLAVAGQNLTPEEIYPFIFAPGLSTALTVTEVSGRGVGMDVVKRNIEDLRG